MNNFMLGVAEGANSSMTNPQEKHEKYENMKNK